MKDMIFSGTAIAELNTLVAQKVASHLFLCCNYNPLPVIGLSEDGKFYPAITNLYNAVIDSSCIVKYLPKFKPTIQVSAQCKGELEECIDVIQLLRSITSHNNSMYNGNREAQRLEDYRLWVQNKIGKDAPQDPNDYAILYRELEGIGDKLYDTLVEYIEVAGQSSEKSQIIDKWEKMIIDWYCGTGAKRDIFIGELENEYLARAQVVKMKNVRFKVARWVRNYYTKEVELMDLQKIYQKTQDIQKRKVLANAIKKRAEKIKQDEEQTIAEYCRDKNPDPYFCYIDRLFSDLKQLLPQTIIQGVCMSMLPDDLLQYQIQLLFNPVPSPDGDFS